MLCVVILILYLSEMFYLFIGVSIFPASIANGNFVIITKKKEARANFHGINPEFAIAKYVVIPPNKLTKTPTRNELKIVEYESVFKAVHNHAIAKP